MSNDAALSTEVAARESADASLEGKVNADISTEVAAREAADASLEAKVNADISTEVAARESADLAEQNARIAGDAAVTAAFEAADSVEKAARLAADASLEVVLSAEISVQNSIDQAIKDGVNGALVEIKSMILNAVNVGKFVILNSAVGDGVTVDFSVLINGSGAIYLNGLLQERDVDYTFSSVVDAKGNTQGTFTFNVAPETGASVVIYGQEAIAVNPDYYGNFTPLA